MAVWTLKVDGFLINYDVILWEKVQMWTPVQINLSEQKATKENQECTSGDYFVLNTGNAIVKRCEMKLSLGSYKI